MWSVVGVWISQLTEQAQRTDPKGGRGLKTTANNTWSHFFFFCRMMFLHEHKHMFCVSLMVVIVCRCC